jgi:hypothetical protein
VLLQQVERWVIFTATACRAAARFGYFSRIDALWAASRVRVSQVVNVGSNLTYGIRTLYAKTFERFDKWLLGDLTALTGPDTDESKPKEAVARPTTDVERAQAEEAAAILESLGTLASPAAPQQPSEQPVSKAINSKKRKVAEKKDTGKV